MNRHSIKIIKIMFSDIPQIVIPVKNEKGHEELKHPNFRPYLQIFKDSKVAFNSLNNTIIPSYVKSDLTIWFDVNITVICFIFIELPSFLNASNSLKFSLFFNANF